MYHNALSDQLYQGCGEKKQVFSQSFNLPICIVVVLAMVEELFSLLLCCESVTNQYAGQKPLTDIWGWPVIT